MSIANRTVQFTLITVTTALLATCGDQATGPGGTPPENSMQVNGALQARFESPTVLANARSHDDLRILQMLVRSESTRGELHEQAQLMVTFAYQAAGSLPDEGDYSLTDGGISEPGTFYGSMNYRLREGVFSDDQCSFRCTVLNLQIDSSEGNRMKGKFSTAGDQMSGMRIRNGLVEDLVLGRDGEIMISGTFDIEVQVD